MRNQERRSFDLLVVGGGINGAGIARDASGRGLSVLLCERDDLASHTSSWSSKLVHGGLRYLEHREFRLVRESLIEREVLMGAAPHLIRPLRFVLPYHDGLRPAWLLRLGLFLYDHIGGRKELPPTKTLDLRKSEVGAPLRPGLVRGFEYSDCFADDARLVVANAVAAKERGAEVLTRTALRRARRTGDRWLCRLEPEGREPFEVEAKAVVNAAGPWVVSLFSSVEGTAARKSLRLVKGSHIVVRRPLCHDRAYILQHKDGRIVFMIPYVEGTTLIGTTDLPYEGDPAQAAISEEETDYLLALVNGYLKEPLGREDIVSTYSGVRPLYDDLSKDDVSAVTRDYAFDIDEEDGKTPLLSVYGGKLTTYRKLAEHALQRLRPYFPKMGPVWTSGAALPGGEGGASAFEKREEELAARYGFLPDRMRIRLHRAYGARLFDLLGDAASLSDLGEHLGGTLYAREVEHLVSAEFARTPEDVLERRTKLGVIDPEAALRRRVRAYLERRRERAF